MIRRRSFLKALVAAPFARFLKPKKLENPYRPEAEPVGVVSALVSDEDFGWCEAAAHFEAVGPHIHDGELRRIVTEAYARMAKALNRNLYREVA